MKTFAPTLFLLVVLGPRAVAQECPDTAPYEAAREVIDDLGTIVSPRGIQESYSTRIGGIDQWLNARGRDRNNRSCSLFTAGPPRR